VDFLCALDAEADVKFHSCLIWVQDGDECQLVRWVNGEQRKVEANLLHVLCHVDGKLFWTVRR